MQDTVWPQPAWIFWFMSSRQMYMQWSSVHTGAGAAKDKTCLCNKSWQESKISPYSENIFLSLLSLCYSEKIRKSNQHSLFLVHPQFYSLEAHGPAAIFRTINQAPWNHRLLVPGQFSWFFFSLGTPVYETEMEWGSWSLNHSVSPLTCSWGTTR